jgi:hypothetical protein
MSCPSTYDAQKISAGPKRGGASWVLRAVEEKNNLGKKLFLDFFEYTTGKASSRLTLPQSFIKTR